MRKTLMLSAVAAHAVAFAPKPAEAPKGDTPAADAPQADAAPAAAAGELKILQFPVGTPAPQRAKPRGPGSKFPFDNLEVGGFFGVADRTAKSLATIIGNQNRKHMVDKTDANGSVVYEQNEIKAADGSVSYVPKVPLKAERVAAKRFYAVDVSEADKATYPGASVLVVREV